MEMKNLSNCSEMQRDEKKIHFVLVWFFVCLVEVFLSIFCYPCQKYFSYTEEIFQI